METAEMASKMLATLKEVDSKGEPKYLECVPPQVVDPDKVSRYFTNEELIAEEERWQYALQYAYNFVSPHVHKPVTLVVSKEKKKEKKDLREIKTREKKSKDLKELKSCSRGCHSFTNYY